MNTGQVNIVANFENPAEMERFKGLAPFGSVLILNVLEHTFDPIRVLDNAATLLRPGGSLITITPAVWPLHSFPMDAWRMLPNFCEEYARRRGCELLTEYFEYIGFGKISQYQNPDGSYNFPPPAQPGVGYWLARALHKTFNTFGRRMFHPSHISLGAVFRFK